MKKYFIIALGLTVSFLHPVSAVIRKQVLLGADTFREYGTAMPPYRDGYGSPVGRMGEDTRATVVDFSDAKEEDLIDFDLPFQDLEQVKYLEHDSLDVPSEGYGYLILEGVNKENISIVKRALEMSSVHGCRHYGQLIVKGAPLENNEDGQVDFFKNILFYREVFSFDEELISEKGQKLTLHGRSIDRDRFRKRFGQDCKPKYTILSSLRLHTICLDGMRLTQKAISMLNGKSSVRLQKLSLVDTGITGDNAISLLESGYSFLDLRGNDLGISKTVSDGDDKKSDGWDRILFEIHRNHQKGKWRSSGLTLMTDNFTVQISDGKCMVIPCKSSRVKTVLGHRR